MQGLNLLIELPRRIDVLQRRREAPVPHEGLQDFGRQRLSVQSGERFDCRDLLRLAEPLEMVDW